MVTKKEIWLPKSETRVTVDMEGNVNVWDSMVMELKQLKSDKTGFSHQAKEK